MVEGGCRRSIGYTMLLRRHCKFLLVVDGKSWKQIKLWEN